MRKPKKDKQLALITAATSFHLPKPVPTDLTIKPDSVLTNPIGKVGMRSWSMRTSTPKGIFIVTASLEGWPTITKEAPFPHEVRLALLDTNPVFQSLGEKFLTKPFEAPQSGVKIKIYVNFFFLYGIGTLRVNGEKELTK